MSALSIEWKLALELATMLSCPGAVFFLGVCLVSGDSVFRAIGECLALFVPVWAFGVLFLHWELVGWAP